MDWLVIYYILIGLAAGTLGSMLGLGGGIIMIPALTILLDVNVKSAISASLINLVATSVMSVSVYARQGLVNYRMGLLFVVPTIIGSFVGSFTGIYVDEKFLLFSFCALLLVASFVMIRRATHAALPHNEKSGISAKAGFRLGGTFVTGAGNHVQYSVEHPLWGSALSSVAGWISGLLGVGGGIIQVPLMNSLCGVPIKVATATSSFMIGFTGLAGALVYFLYERVDLVMTSALVIGIVTGSVIGSRLGVRMSSKYLQTVFVIVLLVTALRLVVKAWNLP